MIDGSQARERKADCLQALAHAAGELHALEHLQQVANVAPNESARRRRAAVPLPGVCEGHDGEIEASAFEECGAKQMQSDMASQSQSSGDEDGQQGDELAGQGGESERRQGEQEGRPLRWGKEEKFNHITCDACTSSAADRKRASHLPNTPLGFLPFPSCPWACTRARQALSWAIGLPPSNTKVTAS